MHIIWPFPDIKDKLIMEMDKVKSPLHFQFKKDDTGKVYCKYNQYCSKLQWIITFIFIFNTIHINS